MIWQGISLSKVQFTTFGIMRSISSHIAILKVDAYSKEISQKTQQAAFAATSRRKGKKKDAASSQEQTGGTFFSAAVERRVRNRAVKDEATKEAQENIRKQENVAMYSKMMELLDKLEDPIKRTDFLRTARQLITRFQSDRIFYPVRLLVNKGRDRH
jgi:DNA-binding transcriptional regulator GbsR (MarR family)